MNGNVALVGGDEFSVDCRSMDLALLNVTGVTCPKVLIVPTAAANERPDKAAFNGVDYFGRLGANASSLMVLDSDDANDTTMVSKILNSDMVYLTGGSPRYLFDVINGSLMLGMLIEAIRKGVMVVGSSAGAMVLGAHMWFGRWVPSLGVVINSAILPHHEDKDPECVSASICRKAPSGVTVFGIDSRSGILFGSSGLDVLGVGSVVIYRDGLWSKFSSKNHIHGMELGK